MASDYFLPVTKNRGQLISPSTEWKGLYRTGDLLKMRNKAALRFKKKMMTLSNYKRSVPEGGDSLCLRLFPLSSKWSDKHNILNITPTQLKYLHYM